MTDWIIPQERPSLSGDEIHLWRVGLDLDEAQAARLEARLSADERARAARFRMGRDRRRFIAARGTLRVLLGQTLDQEPSRLLFTYGAHGKPALLLPESAPPLAFNMSHSGEIGLIALRRGGEIGIDVELVREDFAWEGIAERFYCAAEIAWLRNLPPAAQYDGFFTLWTRKEAYLKALGEGVWHDLSRFDVSQSPVRAEGGVVEPNVAWHLQDLDPGGRCKAAVAVQGFMPPLRTWQWTLPNNGGAREAGMR